MHLQFKKIVIAGGSGQVGKAIVDFYKSSCEEIIILSRKANLTSGCVRSVQWDGKNTGAWCAELEGADMLINLTGKNVNCRHNATNRKLILESRIDSIQVLAKAISLCKTTPAIWIQAASAAIYPHKLYKPMTEHETGTGEGFMTDVSKTWEEAFIRETAEFKNMRKVLLRISLVLGKYEGVFPRLKMLVKFGLGGQAGNGKQYMSWIHETDLARAVDWVAAHQELDGPVNFASTHPLTNAKFMQVLRRKVGIPFGLPTPEFALKIGAGIIGTEAGLVLDSMWVLPEKLDKGGFKFEFPDLDKAVNELINS